ncbi:glycoside hydrolase family 16 protein [Cantharellus anzutake]|uniref:glycoside hydrolase family 16 protein n=1 Tax=Cantharellus anzutake TaxID=1750568 RepID=UPI0019046A63|nr:glycoside hydrolase family 16 protein [Cantharellus anzutake]KAF8335481.1 glycoside hydrolase family 16 protein [Cantharellus anzutake]
MVYVNNVGQAIMQVDRWTTLAPGQARNSVRIESYAVFNKGLFILDVEAAPWGCGVWPAWWTVGPNWPWGGEIDILEGVHDNVHNAMTFHTQPGCSLPTPNPKTSLGPNSTGWIESTDCNAFANSNSGCQTVDTSQASYGTQFNVLKGGVFAMMWADDGIRIWFFHRAAIPEDLQENAPQPNNWGTPVAFLHNTLCPTSKIFYDHQMIFDITFCGDWAGTSYISSGCPGTCSQRVMTPSNFANASWTINSLQVYRSPQISGASLALPRPRSLMYLSAGLILLLLYI